MHSNSLNDIPLPGNLKKRTLERRKSCFSELERRKSNFTEFGKDVMDSKPRRSFTTFGHQVCSQQSSSPKAKLKLRKSFTSFGTDISEHKRSTQPKRNVHGMKKNPIKLFSSRFSSASKNTLVKKDKNRKFEKRVDEKRKEKKRECLRNLSVHVEKHSSESDDEHEHHQHDEVYCHQNCSVADSMRKIEKDKKYLEMVTDMLRHKDTEHVIVETIFDPQDRKREYVISWKCRGTSHSGPNFPVSLHVSAKGKSAVKYNKSQEICVSRFNYHIKPILLKNFQVADSFEVGHSLLPGHDLGGRVIREIFFLKGAAHFRYIMNHNLGHILHTLAAFKTK